MNRRNFFSKAASFFLAPFAGKAAGVESTDDADWHVEPGVDRWRLVRILRPITDAEHAAMARAVRRSTDQLFGGCPEGATYKEREEAFRKWLVGDL